MFQGWDSFFLLIGGAAGAMIGLLFVVASLPSGVERESRMRGARLYITPVVFHFAVVVVLSALALAPRLPVAETAGLVGICALVGIVHLAWVSWQIGSPKTPAPPHWSDFWCYGVGPLVVYLAMAVAAATAACRWTWAAEAVGGACLVLLLVAVRNAWDLVTWLSPTAEGPSENVGGPPVGAGRASQDSAAD